MQVSSLLFSNGKFSKKFIILLWGVRRISDLSQDFNGFLIASRLEMFIFAFSYSVCSKKIANPKTTCALLIPIHQHATPKDVGGPSCRQ